MAFAKRTQGNANVSNQQADDWKAQGFINLYLPGTEGANRKLGAIPLKVSKAAEKQLLDWLKADPTNIDKLVSKLKLTFQEAEPEGKPVFALD